MILIIGESHDQSTTEIIEWLISKNQKIIRINEKNPIQDIVIELTDSDYNIKFKCGSNIINIKDVSFYYYRRGDLEYSFDFLKNLENISIKKKLLRFYFDEFNAVRNFILKSLEQKPHIGDFFMNEPNKIEVLVNAMLCDLKIPNTIISDDLNELLLFANKNRSVITKPIQDIFDELIDEFKYVSYTKIVKSKDFVSSKNFGVKISKLQKEIKKKYELRIFFVDDDYYTMAIFSNNIDFRNQENNANNRMVPFNLPIEIERKLKKLMNSLGLTTGSIDMIVNEDNEYVFLEVNPVGQFGMLSEPCNYNLEEKIANKLIRNDG